MYPALSNTEIRKDILQKRLSISERELKISSDAVFKSLKKVPRFVTAKSIGIYLAYKGEIETLPIIEFCWEKNISVYLPLLHPFSPGHLLFLRYEKDTAMTKNKFGILEPELNVSRVINPANLDLIITPLVAFTPKLERLGLGGGYYDRTFQNYSRTAGKLIGIAHDFQKIETFHVQTWDITLSAVITPKAIHKI